MVNPTLMSKPIATEQRPDPRGAQPQPRRRASARFYVCVGVLLLAAVSMQSAARYFEVTFRKQAAPLKRPLVALDTKKLTPDYRLNAVQPAPINEEVLVNVGTEEYLQWNLDDLSIDRGDPTRMAHLFITYYTGEPDAVPHNPEECYQAGGARLLNKARVTLEMPGPDGEQISIPISILEFAPSSRSSIAVRGSDDSLFVAYFFYANGKYVTSRTAVRTAVSNLWDEYAYYCKIEMTFSDAKTRVRPANREQTVVAVKRLLRKAMPILWEDHFQDWKALKEGAEPVVLFD